jgi:hypothetical protein
MLFVIRGGRDIDDFPTGSRKRRRRHKSVTGKYVFISVKSWTCADIFF